MKVNNSKKITKETSNQFGVVLEDINSKFDFLVEAHSALDKKIDQVREELKEDLNFFKAETRNNFKIIIDDLNGFKQETKRNFKIVFEYLSRIDDEVQDIKEKIFRLELTLKSKVEISELELLKKRVVLIERVILREKSREKVGVKYKNQYQSQRKK